MVKNCHNCEHHTWGDEWWNCKTECDNCKYTDMQGEKVTSNWKPLPMTNADRIRAMSDDELAEWLVIQTVHQEAAFSPPSYRNFLTDLDDTKESAIKDTKEWLKQPADQDEEEDKRLQRSGRWIPVTERLPEKITNKVIVLCKNGYRGFGHYEDYKGKQTWYNLESGKPFTDWDLEDCESYEVTHWMPLPQPPKGE